MPGPSKLPPQLKLLRGTAGRNKRRARSGNIAPEAPSLTPFVVTPSPPTWLKNLDAVREWQRLAPVLTANRLLHAGNVGLLAQACAVHGRLVTIWSTGDAANAALVATYRALCGALGLTGWSPSTAKPGNTFKNNAAAAKPGKP